MPLRGNISWGWRKILQLRPFIQNFIWSRIGDGALTSAGLSMSSKVQDVINNDDWSWPVYLLDKYSMLSIFTLRNIDDSTPDQLESHNDVGLSSPSPFFSHIMSIISPIANRKSSRSIIAKLVMVASTYFIWQERNGRLFKKSKREAHIDYLKNTQEQADIHREIVKQAKAKQPLNNALDFSLRKRSLSHTKTRSRKLGLKCSTSNCGSKPTRNKKNDKISQTPSTNMKKKVKAQPRKVNKNNRVVEPIRNVNVKQSQLNANSELICATCKKFMFDGVHDMCLLDFVKNVNSHAKSAKKHKKQNIWKPTGHVFNEAGFQWKPTCRTFTIVDNPMIFEGSSFSSVGKQLAKSREAKSLDSLGFKEFTRSSISWLMSRGTKVSLVSLSFLAFFSSSLTSETMIGSSVGESGVKKDLDALVVDSNVCFKDCFLLGPLLAPGFLPWGTSSVGEEYLGALESTGTSRLQMAFMWSVKGGSL
nr:hypothetical protein [Tanacetum cinerariifolium]